MVQVSLAEADAPERPYSIANGRLRFCADGLRYVADDGTLIDMYGASGSPEPTRMEIAPGNAWNGEPPAAFYGTATAALLAARGDLPMHGSAVELGGKAVLLCGHSGAGKSTLTAALIAAGARLLSDDLSSVSCAPSIQSGSAGDEPVLYSGRRAIRLFPDVAAFLSERTAVVTVHAAGEPKVLAMPRAAPPDRAFPLAAVVILGEEKRAHVAEASGLKLLEFSFRRRAFRHLPNFDRRVGIARRVASAVPLLTLPGVQVRSREQFRAVADDALQHLTSAGISG